MWILFNPCMHGRHIINKIMATLFLLTMVQVPLWFISVECRNKKYSVISLISKASTYLWFIFPPEHNVLHANDNTVTLNCPWVVVEQTRVYVYHTDYFFSYSQGITFVLHCPLNGYCYFYISLTPGISCAYDDVTSK